MRPWDVVDDAVRSGIPDLNGAITRRTGERSAITGTAHIVDAAGVVRVLRVGGEAIQCLQIVHADSLVRSAYQEEVPAWVDSKGPDWMYVLQNREGLLVASRS